MKRLLYLRIPLSSLTIGRLIAALSILGIGGLCYVCGAAVMFFQLPSCDFLDKAFRGARDWRERGRSTIPLLDLEEVDEFRKMGGIRVDKAEETWDGFTLYTTTSGAQATMRNFSIMGTCCYMIITVHRGTRASSSMIRRHRPSPGCIAAKTPPRSLLSTAA